jgi:SAM-dependent methyltransferase
MVSPFSEVIEHSIEDQFTVSDSTIKYFRPENPSAILDAMTDEEYEKDKFLPYWAEVWPSVHALVRYLSARSISDRQHICEIGCGLALASSFLAQKNHHLTAIDISPAACAYANRNIRLQSALGNALCCDWRRSPFKGTFDIIIASDVLYEPRWIEPVLSFVKNTLSASGRAIIADPKRASWEQFKVQATQSYGMQVDVTAINDVPGHSFEIAEIY